MRTLFAALLAFSLFADVRISSHSIQLENEKLSYTTTVATGDISYIAYVKEGENRPITFAFNGGPGSSSVWLHMGTFGPRRIVSPEEGQAIFPPYKMIDNPDTILDLTDLVFIDPKGTGLSEPKKEEDTEDYYSVRGDIKTVGDFIRSYLTENKRWNSPKYIAGESYGALRASGLADYLQDEYGIYLNGLILISAAIDYQTFIFNVDNPAPYFLFFPSFVTTAWYHERYLPAASIEEVAGKARAFAYQTYAPSLLCRKCTDLDAVYQQIAEMTSLPLSLVQRQLGRIDDDLFFREFLASEKKIVGRFDSRYTGFLNPMAPDPSGSLISGIFAGAFHDYLHKELEFPASYNLISSDVHNQWNYWDYNRWGLPNLMMALRRALICNPSMKVFVGCGYFDLATPFAAAEYCFDHLDVPDIAVQMEYYEGGHMFYLNPEARSKFKRDLIRFYQRNSP